MKGKKSFWLIIGLLIVTLLIVYGAEVIKLNFYHLYRYLYLIPILTSAYFFGMRGGIFVALVITLIYTPPLLWDINKNKLTRENIDLAVILFFFNGVGLAIGQMFGTLMKQRQMAQILYEVNRDVSATRDYDELLKVVLRKVMGVTNARGGSLILFDTERKIEARVEKNLDKEIDDIQFDTENDLWKELTVKGEVFICNNVEYSLKSALIYKLTRTRTENYLAIPIKEKDRVVGVIGIYNKLDPDNENIANFTNEDVKLLNIMGNQVIIAIENAKLLKEMVGKERLAEELRLGKEIQKNLLPRKSPIVAGLNIVGFMEPAKEIGGDYYDYIVTSADSLKLEAHREGQDSQTAYELPAISKIAIVIGDVSGKGVAAGLIMATAKATLKGLSEQQLSPKEILSRANNILYEYTQGERFMTMLYLTWDNQQKKLNYSSAGHEYIIIWRSPAQQTLAGNPDRKEAARIEVIRSGGVMLGMRLEIETFLEDKALKLNPGDKVILYTDGVTDAHNPQDELYTLKRFTESVKKHGHKSCLELITALKDEVYSFIGTMEQYDDITLLVMEVVPSEDH